MWKNTQKNAKTDGAMRIFTDKVDYSQIKVVSGNLEHNSPYS